MLLMEKEKTLEIKTFWFGEVGDFEVVLYPTQHSPHSEVEPLQVSRSVQVLPQIQLIFVCPSGCVGRLTMVSLKNIKCK